MTQKEFNALKPGDKVRIVKEKRGGNWNNEGLMDKWLGKVMTVRTIGDFITMEEDRNEGLHGWAWFPEMIDCKVPKFQKGDRVRMKSWEAILEMAGKTAGEAVTDGSVVLPSGITFHTKTSRYCGEEYTIKLIDAFIGTPVYLLDGVLAYLFSEEVLEAVEDGITRKGAKKPRRSYKIIKCPLQIMLKSKGITQERLAQEIGSTQGNISNWFRGVTTPHMEHLQGMARFFGMTTDEVISLLPTPKSKQKQNSEGKEQVPSSLPAIEARHEQTEQEENQPPRRQRARSSLSVKEREEIFGKEWLNSNDFQRLFEISEEQADGLIERIKAKIDRLQIPGIVHKADYFAFFSLPSVDKISNFGYTSGEGVRP